MATVIDALLITLGLDTKQLEDNSKKAQASLKKTGEQGAKDLKDIEAAGKKAADVLTKLKNEALALTAILLGAAGLKEFVANTTKANIEAGNFAKNIGMSVNELRAWKNAAAAAGGSADDMQSALGAMNDALQTYRLQGKFTGPMEYFASLGISARDAKGNLITAGEAMMAISRALQSRPFQDQASILKKMGFGDGVIGLLAKAPSEIQAALKEMHGLGDATDGAYESSKALNAEWVKLKASIEAAAISLEKRMDPTLTAILKKLQDGAQAIKKWSEEPSQPAKPYAPRNNAAAHVKLPDWLEWFLSVRGMRGSKGGLMGPPVPPGFQKPAGDAVPSGNLFSALESRYGLPPGLLNAVWAAESGKGKNMLSPAGAMGHFQFMPDTAKAYGLKDPGDLNESAHAAARMFRDLLAHYGGNLQKALAGYNWGSGNLDKNGMGRLPSETSAYIARVMGGMGPSMASGGTTFNETHIGSITVNTKATDANGIARELPGAISRQSMVAQSATGVN